MVGWTVVQFKNTSLLWFIALCCMSSLMTTSLLKTSFTELIQKYAFQKIMLSIQEFSSLACAVLLMVILGFVIKINKSLLSRDARLPEPICRSEKAKCLRNEENYKYNYSFPCNCRQAREHDERQ